MSDAHGNFLCGALNGAQEVCGKTKQHAGEHTYARRFSGGTGATMEAVDDAIEVYDRMLRETPVYNEWVAIRRQARRKRERRAAFWQGVRCALGLGPRRGMSPEARLQQATITATYERSGLMKQVSKLPHEYSLSPRVQNDSDGTLDDFLAMDVATVHFEAIDQSRWYATITLKSGDAWQLDFGAQNPAAKGYARAEQIDHAGRGW